MGAVLLAGCGGSGSSSEASQSDSNQKQPVNLAMVETFSAIPYFQVAKAGGEAAAKANDANLTVQAPPFGNGTNEATMAANLLAQEPAGFAPNPCVLPAWGKVLKEMSEQVPNNNNVAWNCAPISEADQKPPIPTFVGTGYKEYGRELARETVEQGHVSPESTGTVLVGNCSPGVPILDEEAGGAVEKFESALPNTKVVEFATEQDQTKNTAAWSSELANTPDVIAATGACDGDSASLALLVPKMAEPIVAAVLDPEAKEFEEISDGTLVGGVTQGPWVIGYVATSLIAEGARGKPAPEGWVNTGFLSVDKSNVAEFQKTLTSTSALEAFYQPRAEKVLAEARQGGNVKPMAALFE